MRRCFAVFLMSLWTMITLSCYVSDTGDGSFLINNNINGYPLLVDIGPTDLAYSFKLKNSLWELYSYRYGTVNDTVDTILHQANTTTKSLLVSSWSDGNYPHRVDNMYAVAEKIYLITNSLSGGPSGIYTYDTTTETAVLLHADSTLQLKSLGADSAYIYFSTVNNIVTCFNTATSLFEDCGVSMEDFFPNDSVLYADGYAYVRRSSSITKIDTAATVTVWETDSLFRITDMILLDNFLYVCGYEGYASSNSSDNWGNYDPVAAKLGLNGTVLWQYNYETSVAEDEDKLQRIISNTAGTIICIGNTGAWQGNEYFYALTLDNNGNLKNEKIFSNNTSTISDMDHIEIQSVPEVAENTLHVLFQGQIDHVRNYYAQITF